MSLNIIDAIFHITSKIVAGILLNANIHNLTCTEVVFITIIWSFTDHKYSCFSDHLMCSSEVSYIKRLFVSSDVL